MPAGDVDGKVDWDSADLTGGIKLSSQESIQVDCSCFRDSCLGFSECVPLSGADLLQKKA